MKNGMKKNPQDTGKPALERNVFLSALFTFALTAVCVVFEVLCLRYFKDGFIARNLITVLVAIFLLTVGYCMLTIAFAVKGKTSLYRLLFSGLILISLFLILLYVVQKTGLFAVFQDEERSREYLESAGGWMPLLCFCRCGTKALTKQQKLDLINK